MWNFGMCFVVFFSVFPFVSLEKGKMWKSWTIIFMLHEDDDDNNNNNIWRFTGYEKRKITWNQEIQVKLLGYLSS